MPLSCQPLQRGPDPRTCQTRPQIKALSHAMGKPLSAKSSQRSNVSSVHTINIVFPEKSHSSHSVASGKGDEPVSTDRRGDRSSSKVDNVHPNAEISAVPDPVPNPLVEVPYYASVPEHTTSMLGSAHIVTSTASSSASVYSPISAVSSTLFPLPSVFTRPSTSSLSLAPRTSVSAERPLHTLDNVPSRQTTSHQLPASAIILLAAGSVLLVATILILAKLFIRPQRRSHPTPSLPILQDAFPRRKLGDESPLFGGKERLSSQPIMNSIPWTWTQYQSDVPKSVPVGSTEKSGPTNQPQMRQSRLVDEPPNVFEPSEPTMQDAPGRSMATNQSSDGHTNKAMSRLSTLSGLVYTGSAYESTGQENIGIAVSSGQGDLEFGGSTTRDHRKRASARQSMRNFDKRRSTIYGSPEGLAYTISPSLPPAGNDDTVDSDGPSRQGRARVKAPYVAGSYLRGSAPKGPDRAHLEVNPFGDPVNGEYVLPPVPGLSTGREADSKRGSFGVGTITPDPAVSPGFGLYPDDSLSAAEDQIWAAHNHVTGKRPTHDDEGGGMAVSDDLLGAVSPGTAARRLSMQKTRARDQRPEKSKRTDDRPPRVPSPPVLPSLAQMAMAHTHGQEYGDYRSPTYSLYGLYSGT